MSDAHFCLTFNSRLVLLLTLLLMLVAINEMAAAQTESALYTFCSMPNCTDGAYPDANLILDGKGNFYGTTEYGGGGNCNGGCGTVFELTKSGTETVLYDFSGNPDGAEPRGGLVRDSKGNLYGTTSGGGNVAGVCGPIGGCGTVFELRKTGKTYTEVVLYAFTGGADGAMPNSSLVRGPDGSLYGTTQGGQGGGNLGCRPYGSSCGVVFKVSPSGNEEVLYAFTGGTDGGIPGTSLIQDAKGNLYGTALIGGNLAYCANLGCGTVFKITPAGSEQVLYAFTGSDGAFPVGGLIWDGRGGFYGTTTEGGVDQGSCAVQASGCGVVFQLTKKGEMKTLYSFTGFPTDGDQPRAAVVRDKQGNLYGTTFFGGNSNYGAVFELTSTHSETLLYNFLARADGSSPGGSLILDASGNLYGTTTYGGNFGFGTVFVLQPGPKLLLIAINPPNAQIGIGDTLPFVAFGVYSDGTRKGITSLVTWSSSNTSVATIQSGGLATGISMGTTAIMASYEGVTGNASLTVN